MHTIYCMIYKCVFIYHILYTNSYIFIKTKNLTNAHSLIYLFVRSVCLLFFTYLRRVDLLGG